MKCLFHPGIPSSRGHSFRLEVPLAKCNTRNHFFACRIVRVWNALPQAVVSSPNVLSFKKLVNKLEPIKISSFPLCTILKFKMLFSEM